MSIKITIVYGNSSIKPELKPDWGFGCVIELDSGKRLLFDTDADGDIIEGKLWRL